jgi:hypothetical protein
LDKGDKGNKECRGEDESFEKEALTAARVAIGFRYDNKNDKQMQHFFFKDCSVRSIDPTKPIHPAVKDTPPKPDNPTMHFSNGH